MSILELQPTPTALWHKLVCDAEEAMDIKLDHDLESYLVFLLMRFTSKPSALSKILALDYLNCQKSSGTIRQELLRDVGDQCLLFSGLFPKLAERRQVKNSYYVNLGRGAYSDLSGSLRHSLANMYAQLSESFVSLMDVLRAIRTSGDHHDLSNPLQAFELWDETKSQHAYKTLLETSNALPASNISHKKH